MELPRGSRLEDTIRPGSVRGLDFISLDKLRLRTGTSAEMILPFALNEILCNSLDKDAAEIKITLQSEGDFDKLTVSDNGSKKLSRPEIELIVDFENEASSKRGFKRVSRGYLGNALKCIFGYSYALAESRNLAPPKIMIATGTSEYLLSLKPDRAEGVIKTEIVESERTDDGYTVFTLKFPKGDVDSTVNLKTMKNIVFATSMVNPTRRISFNFYGEERALGTSEAFSAINKDTSVEWYTFKQFTELFEDYLRANPQLKDFLAMFRGFTGRKVIREILQAVNAGNRDSQSMKHMQFFPTSTLKDMPKQSLNCLFAVMKAKAKPVKKRSISAVLGAVGESSFIKVQQENKWERLRYICLKDTTSECPDPYLHTFTRGRCQNVDHIEYPYLIELAVFDRKDKEGVEVYSCVNFMASSEPIFSRSFNVALRLGEVGIKKETPMTIIVHLVCPVLKWLNFGKNALDDVDTKSLMEKAFDKILPIPKTLKVYHPPPPPRPLSWVPHGKLGDEAYEDRLKDFAGEVLAVESQRTKRMKFSSRGWCYILEGLGKIDKGEFDACQKAINDCRKIGLLPIDFVAEDQDTTRQFKGIHQAADPLDSLRQMRHDLKEMLECLPSNITDYWTGEKFYLIMCVEKGDLVTLFKPICDEYHVPIVSSKGWSPINSRRDIANLSRKAEANNLTPVLLLFYDHDPAGLKITKTFRKNLEDCERGTHWNPSKLIIERFGLNKTDIDRFNLAWIKNLKTGSGRESRDYEYRTEFGDRKCEANALVKNDETLKAAEEICRKAIENYYGVDATERFRRKESESKQKLAIVYDDPAWQNFDKAISNIMDSLSIEEPGETESKKSIVPKLEVDVFIKKGFYGLCPKCNFQFEYSEETDIGRLLICRVCDQPMRLRWAPETKS